MAVAAIAPIIVIRAVMLSMSAAMNLLGHERELATCSRANMAGSSYQDETKLAGNSYM